MKGEPTIDPSFQSNIMQIGHESLVVVCEPKAIIDKSINNITQVRHKSLTVTIFITSESLENGVNWHESV